MTYSVEFVKKLYDQQQHLRFLFFWGHQNSKDGSITSSCFSQWWEEHPFEVEGEVFKTAEHWMMAGKARLFNDEVVREQIMVSIKPAVAKELGRQVTGFNPIIWDREKFNLVKQGNFYKFTQHQTLREYLKSTGELIIVEASPVDIIWGIGLSKNDPGIENPYLWKGENLLGFSLMEVRDMLL